jgi:hypothetical protein
MANATPPAYFDYADHVTPDAAMDYNRVADELYNQLNHDLPDTPANQAQRELKAQQIRKILDAVKQFQDKHPGDGFCLPCYQQQQQKDHEGAKFDSAKARQDLAKQAKIYAYDKINPNAKYNFMIFHGWKGLDSNPRFAQMAQAIKDQFGDQANVYVGDWSAASKGITWGNPDNSLPQQAVNTLGMGWVNTSNAYDVAQNIEPTGQQFAQLMQQYGIDPSKTTTIAESYGNYVAIAAAKASGKKWKGMLMFNPANEVPLPGGKKGAPSGHLADPSQATDNSWAFYTPALGDTYNPIAKHNFHLQTTSTQDGNIAYPGGQGEFFGVHAGLPTSDWHPHTEGVEWLRDQVQGGNTNWLLQNGSGVGLHSPVGPWDGRVGNWDGYVLHNGTFRPGWGL